MPQNVGLFAFLRGIFMGLLILAKSQTLPRALTLRTSARILWGVFSPFSSRLSRISKSRDPEVIEMSQNP